MPAAILVLDMSYCRLPRLRHARGSLEADAAAAQACSRIDTPGAAKRARAERANFEVFGGSVEWRGFSFASDRVVITNLNIYRERGEGTAL